jgi:hypothetical protein
MKTIYLCNFWSGYNLEKNNLTDIFSKYNFTTNINEADTIITCCFFTNTTYKQLLDIKNKDIYAYITEPVEYTIFHCIDLFRKKKFKGIFGCVPMEPDNNSFKFPLYLNYFNYTNLDTYTNTNLNSKNINLELLNTKKFCTLIASHDHGKTRKPIFDIISEINHIDSPGRFANNMSNEYLNSIGNIKFINEYIFHICPINFYCREIKGYNVEKLLNCCLGGAIPIYYGEIDDIDQKIFNINRIIFFDPTNPKSLKETHDKIKELWENKTKLLEFYQQQIFMDTSRETCIYMREVLRTMI